MDAAVEGPCDEAPGGGEKVKGCRAKGRGATEIYGTIINLLII